MGEVPIHDVLTRHAGTLDLLGDGRLYWQEPVVVCPVEGELGATLDEMELMLRQAREKLILALWSMGGLLLSDGKVRLTPFYRTVDESRLVAHLTWEGVHAHAREAVR